MAEKLLTDPERNDSQKSSKSKDRFPLIVIIIVIAEFCERFSYSGMKAFLALYLKSKLMFSDDEATELYHAFTCLMYFFPILGAIIADNYLGKFRTILYMMFVYAAGNMVVAIAAIPQLALPGRLCTSIGLLLISVGAGGIKPCVSAFGGDQFELPRQERHLAVYFMVLYFTLCSGSLIAKTLSPILRSEIHCFGDKDCYSVAFGAPGIIMILSIVIFAGAKKLYVLKKPTGNVVMDVLKCIALGLKNKFQHKMKSEKNSHWLDSTENLYDKTFITDIKKTLSILVLYLPLPVFWALLDQMGSRWTLQATRMNGDFGFFTLKPDQMQVMAPIIILIIIPLFQKFLYPCLERLNILRNPLHKLTLGGVLAGVSFIVSGYIELHLQSSYPQIPQTHYSQMRLYNGYPCSVNVSNQQDNISHTILPYTSYTNRYIRVENGFRNITLDVEGDCVKWGRKSFLLEEKMAVGFYLSNLGVVRYEDDVRKSRSGYPLVRFLTSDLSPNTTMSLYNEKRHETEISITSDGVSALHEVYPSSYSVMYNDLPVTNGIKMGGGGVYTLVLGNHNGTYVSEVITVTEPNSVSMALLLPQFIIISVAEVLFAVTGMEFAFKEAPESMKAVLQASWLLSEAFGNVLIILVTRLAVNYGQATQSFIYTGLIVIAMIIFYFLAESYQFTSEMAPREPKQERAPEQRKTRSNSEVLYMQVKQCEEFVEH